MLQQPSTYLFLLYDTASAQELKNYWRETDDYLIWYQGLKAIWFQHHTAHRTEAQTTATVRLYRATTQSSCCSTVHSDRPEMTLLTFKDNWRPICSTSDESTNIRNIHDHPAWFRRRLPNCRRTYLLTYNTEWLDMNICYGESYRSDNFWWPLTATNCMKCSRSTEEVLPVVNIE